MRAFAESKEDALKYATFLQILHLLLTAAHKDRRDATITIEKTLWPAVKRGDIHIVALNEEEENRLKNLSASSMSNYAGYPLIPFEEFKTKQIDRVSRLILENVKRKNPNAIANPQEFIKAIKLAAEAADKIIEEKKKRSGGQGLAPINGDIKKIPELVEAIKIIAKMLPAEYRKTAGKTPKYPQVQKQDTPKWILETVPEGVKLEVLSLLKAVELVGSPEVRSKAAEELREKVREIANGELSEEALLKAGLYAVAAELIAPGKDEKLKELLDTG
ncbi:hypothetical protein [Thermococcus peptonophilus]|uniref:hypothetical protein n=1 Tax=Thermococcus peptonophilus TaxID=53952 RepID=UPI0012E722E5|nr:hypothetical protein [Thermococcus peptonophilus]